MWQRSLLTKCSGVSTNLFRYGRYIIQRKYSDVKKIEDVDSSTKASSEDDIKNLLNDAANFNEVTDTSWASSPYPASAAIPSEIPERPKQDPSTAAILLFPGQGSLKVGKVSEYLNIPRAREIFDIAHEVLGFNLLDMCLKGPQKKLNQTEFNQIATVATSLAALEKIWEERPAVIEQCKVAAGYSVGELTALIFSGAFSLEDGIRLAAVRGAAMQHASNLKPQGMLLIECFPQTKIGVICDEARKWAMDMGVDEPVCEVAIYIYSEAKVLAGDEQALKYIEHNCKRLAIKRTHRLPVSGAFHTSLMAPAIKSFKKALDKIDVEPPRIATYSNCSTRPYRHTEQIRKLLLKQIVKPVKWEQIIHSIYGRDKDEHYPRTFEIGSHGTLKSILQHINVKASNFCVTI